MPYSYKVLEVNSSIEDLVSFAEENNISYKELKMLNPWLLTDKLPNAEKKKYQIKILIS